MHYNVDLANELGLSASTRQKLDSKYVELFNVLYAPWAWDAPAAQVKKIEFDLQALWGFPKDAKFHRYQTSIRGCTCPDTRHIEGYGHTEHRLVNKSCPWHSTSEDAKRARKNIIDMNKESA